MELTRNNRCASGLSKSLCVLRSCSSCSVIRIVFLVPDTELGTFLRNGLVLGICFLLHFIEADISICIDLELIYRQCFLSRDASDGEGKYDIWLSTVLRALIHSKAADIYCTLIGSVICSLISSTVVKVRTRSSEIRSCIQYGRSGSSLHIESDILLLLVVSVICVLSICIKTYEVCVISVDLASRERNSEVVVSADIITGEPAVIVFSGTVISLQLSITVLTRECSHPSVHGLLGIAVASVKCVLGVSADIVSVLDELAFCV